MALAFESAIELVRFFMERVAHIVPTVPPEFNGLGDYCYYVCKYWPEPKPEWHILTTRIPEGAQAAWPEANFHRFERTRAGLSRALVEIGADLVVLHYVPHAYQPKGVPFWLPSALSDWKKQSQGRLIVVFHELFATAPLWRITGWLTPFAKAVLRGVVRQADNWTTSTEVYFRQLQIIGRAKPALGRLIPVGPNIEVIPNADTIPRHRGKFILFGTARTRSLAVKRHSDLLRSAVISGKARSISLIGSRPTEPARTTLLAGLRDLGFQDNIEEHYDLPADEVSEQLLTGEIALMATDAPFRNKSGAYAACRVHDLLCVFPGETLGMESFPGNADDKPDWPKIVSQLPIFLTETSQ